MRKGLIWFFTDRSTGRIVVAQWPNWTLWTFIVTWALSLLVPAGRLATGFGIIAALVLAIWAIDEIARGSSPFRRVLGLLVLIYEATRWL